MTVVDDGGDEEHGRGRAGQRDGPPTPGPERGARTRSVDPVRLDRWMRPVTDAFVVAGAALFVFWQLHPSLILTDTTPAGGDMGAHVWAFGYLRDVLLPSGQWAGWTPDWYAGFPAFHFYMVVPFLGMVVLNAGSAGVAMVVPATASVALSVWAAIVRTGREKPVAALAGNLEIRLPVARALCGLVAAAIAAVIGTVGLLVGFAPGFVFVVMVVAAGLGVAVLANPPRPGVGRHRASGVAVAAVVVAIGGISLPYGVAFKVIAVSGVVAMPVTAYLFLRLSGLRYPIPALGAVGVTAFLFDTNWTILGGNITSTMAGEFAFSISLALALAYLGVLVRGLRTGGHRAATAVLLALTGLCHLIPAFFALAMTAILVIAHVVTENSARPGRDGGAEAGADTGAVQPDRPRSFWVAAVAVAVAAVIVVAALVVAAIASITTPPILAVTGVALVVTALYARLALPPVAGSLAAEPRDAGAEADAAAAEAEADEHGPGEDRTVIDGFWGFFGVRRLWWLASAGMVAAMLGAWWVLPFYAKRTYLNDMGWGKTAVHREGTAIIDWFREDVWSSLVNHDQQLYAVLALIGAILAVVFANRVAASLAIAGLVAATAFVYVPQGRLWNERLLPFWFLVLFLLAAIGVGEIVRAAAEVLGRGPGQPVRGLTWAAAPVVALALGGFLAAQLNNLPVLGDVGDDGRYEVLGMGIGGRNIGADWARWNFEGYEAKEAYPEYHDIVTTMADVGATHGCGRAMWEYNSAHNNYGTPMALMLMPHWTEGCIGSMEGLYFEASVTTPYHFLIQSELSHEPSRAQRDMPYRDFDIDAGVEHLQLMGVQYYMAYTPEATQAAAGHEELIEVATSGPWTVYEVADAPLVEPLGFRPVVTTSGASQDSWLCAAMDDANRCSGPALDWFQDPDAWDVALAATGPDEWSRVDFGDQAPRHEIEPAVVSGIERGNASISFTVDEPGRPVLVKESYFPNWQASGADGPYRVAPNLMVVVPTDTEVTLRYQRIGVDYLAIALTLAGIVAVVALARRPRLVLPGLREAADLVAPSSRPPSEPVRRAGPPAPPPQLGPTVTFGGAPEADE